MLCSMVASHYPIYASDFNRVLRIPTVIVLAAFTSIAAPPPFPTARTPLQSRVALEDG